MTVAAPITPDPSEAARRQLAAVVDGLGDIAARMDAILKVAKTVDTFIERGDWQAAASEAHRLDALCESFSDAISVTKDGPGIARRMSGCAYALAAHCRTAARHGQ